jgi:hypothetical protein
MDTLSVSLQRLTDEYVLFIKNIFEIFFSNYFVPFIVKLYTQAGYLGVRQLADENEQKINIYPFLEYDIYFPIGAPSV